MQNKSGKMRFKSPFSESGNDDIDIMFVVFAKGFNVDFNMGLKCNVSVTSAYTLVQTNSLCFQRHTCACRHIRLLNTDSSVASQDSWCVFDCLHKRGVKRALIQRCHRLCNTAGVI